MLNRSQEGITVPPGLTSRHPGYFPEFPVIARADHRDLNQGFISNYFKQWPVEGFRNTFPIFG